MKQKAIQYSRLRYEQIPYRKGRVPRVWKQESVYKSFFKELLKDIWKFLKLIKRLYRKELVVGSILILALAPAPHHVKAEVVPVTQPYIQPIERLQPVAAIPVAVPQEAPPAPAPQPVAPPVAPAPVATPGSYPMGANTYRDYIFKVESGFNPGAVNPGGCIGYGQDCNGWLITGRLNSVACPNWQTDIACQLQYWDWYANTVYNGWGNAYAFRTTHNYW